MTRKSPLVVLALALASACGPAPAAEKRSALGTATAETLSGELASTAAPATGLTTVWLSLTESGAPVTDATLTLMPKMTMSSMSHACPVVGEVVSEGQGVYRAQLVFQMASSETDTWKLDVKVERPGKDAKVLSYPLTVADSGLARVFTVKDPSNESMSTKYVMSFSVDGAPKVGLNTAVITLHTMKDMMTFVPFDTATLEMVPEMPSMGHGSSNNVAPTLKSPGRYEGTINFSMMGEWKTTVTVKSGDALLSTASFTTTL